MFFLSKALWYLFEPSNLLVLLLVLGLVLARCGYATAGRRTALFAAGGMLAILVLPLAQWLAMPLEDRYPRPTLPAHVDGILVLGGGAAPDILHSRGTIAHEEAVARLLAAAELARRFPRAVLIFSGGSSDVMPGNGSESDVARYVFAQIGLPPQRALYENRSRNTWENFQYAMRVAHPRAGQTWILVTSAFHLPRAMAVARHFHWTMIPWAAAYYSQAHGHVDWDMDYAHNAETLEFIVHEWLGLIAYRIGGRTDALFP